VPSVTVAESFPRDAAALEALRRQRDQALGCCWFSFVIAAAVFATALGSRDTAIAEARQAVAVHQALFRQTVELLEQNQKELHATKASLERLQAAER